MLNKKFQFNSMPFIDYKGRFGFGTENIYYKKSETETETETETDREKEKERAASADCSPHLLCTFYVCS